ncbi:RdRP-domain-containing protein [Vararia minispora EC-137]|uniref:RdRP-domain-containing protein n=1 Tax=Vararia minispora EC-137 TaxID=1314806 RepID=A0ACB8Q9C2_9AGAM|nr:RdRP-domain-containing protein [Vararia minispora EC-137]
MHHEDPMKIIVASFDKFRFPDTKPSVASEYIFRMLTTGLFLNEKQYRFFGHGNSQLRGRGCYLKEADADAELDERIYAMGQDLKKIMNVAKRAKRIGLLFSGAEIDWILRDRVGDIDDLMTGDENFSDGCGLISKWLSIQLSKKKGIVYQAQRYAPTVFQIRYRGYKGVVMLHPDLDKEKKHVVAFRKSQKKFVATIDDTFSVVGHSMPYTFGRLNNEIVVLLSGLGVTNDVFLHKQEEYFRWIEDASKNVIRGFEFLSSISKHPVAEKLFLYGFGKPADLPADDPRTNAFRKIDVLKEIGAAQRAELAAFRKNDDEKKERVRMLVHKSRRLYGVCDPYRMLKEGQVHVRITTSRNGAATLKGLDVIVVRNPCLHPGDILKLRAVDHPRLAHLVDCVVFASVGKRAAPSMSSGGDLDGDEYFVCWDPDLVPRHISESYTYPPNKEQIKTNIMRSDLARYFAFWNNSGMARTTALHNKWARYAPDGALSKECQELNALYSQAVDGARVTIPERLRSPPEPPEGSEFVLTVLAGAAREFSQRWVATGGDADHAPLDHEIAEELIHRLFSVEESTLPEARLVTLAHALARRHNIDFRPYMTHVNWGALTTADKYSLAVSLGMDELEQGYMWNSLLRSDIVTAKDLEMKKLGGPLRVQRLYTSKALGLPAFFDYLVRAMQNYTRKLIIIKLFNGQRGNSFIHIRKPPVNSNEDFITSIALQQISQRVQKQMGRVYRQPVVGVEIHVVSNRDRVAHQLFDLRFQHVDTEEFIKRFAHTQTVYLPNALSRADLTTLSEPLRVVFSAQEADAKACLYAASTSVTDLDACAEFAWQHRCEAQLFWIFDALIAVGRYPLDKNIVGKWIDRHPLLVFCILKAYVPDEEGKLPADVAELGPAILQQVLRAAPAVPVAALVALEKLKGTLATIELRLYLSLLELAVLAIRAPGQVHETLFVLHECREAARASSAASEYIHKQALCIAFDRAEEANDTCPCDEDGRLRRQRGGAPALVPLHAVKDKLSEVVADIRVDSTTTIRLHSHVRLRAESRPEQGDIEQPILDGIVTVQQTGEIRIALTHTPPPEYESMQWYLYDAGSVATSRAMMEAVLRLATGGADVCRFHRAITETALIAAAAAAEDDSQPLPENANDADSENLNASQRRARDVSQVAQISLIWGPPAVDNVLERFLRLNEAAKLLPAQRIVRFATERSRVSRALQHLTLEGHVGGEIVRDKARKERAEELLKDAAVVFTTCAAAGLGTLRALDSFDIVLIDEASQITEPVALIPLVKGCRSAVLVGDHVQLRPMVRTLGHAMLYDVSLFERLYTGPSIPGLTRTMLDVQYRFPEALAHFPSSEFYEGRLRSSITGTKTVEVLAPLERVQFPWPRADDGSILPAVFVQCGTEEEYGGVSKSNQGQAQLVKYIVRQLSTTRDAERGDDAVSAERKDMPSIAVLSPYTKQTRLHDQTLNKRAQASTIDAFQGREADVIVFSTVRANPDRDIGFVEDMRRLNVAWTRARLALIVVGDEGTLAGGSELWRRAIASCTKVQLAIPEEGN